MSLTYELNRNIQFASISIWLLTEPGGEALDDTFVRAQSNPFPYPLGLFLKNKRQRFID